MHVHDITGRIVRTIRSGLNSPGINRVVWNGTDDNGNAVSNGQYIVTITTDRFRSSRMLVVSRLGQQSLEEWILRVSFETVPVPAGTTQYVTVDLRTSEIPGDGRVRMRFHNVFDPTDQFIQTFYAVTSATGVNEPDNQRLTVFPDPTYGDLRVI